MDHDQAPPGTTTTDNTPPDGPRVTGEQVRDFSRLRRSATDRYVGGVAGGVGRHLDVDPTVVRVVLVVLAFFGGAGLLVYAAVWLLVPEDGRDRAPLDLGPDLAKIAVVVSVALAAMFVLGVPFLGLGDAFSVWPLLLLALGAAWLVSRSRRRTDAASATAPTVGPTSAPSDTTLASSAPAVPSAWGPPPPTAAAPVVGPPLPPPPPLPPRPRRTGPVLFWPTLAAVALALGLLGLLDVSARVPVSAYAALGLAVVGLALLLGAFRARPGGLVALGLVGVLALGATSAVDVAKAYGPYGSTTTTPATAAAVQPRYSPDSGEFVLDLRQVADPATLDGRTVRVAMELGRITVVLPEGVSAEVTSDVRWAGEVLVNNSNAAGAGDFEVVRPVGDPATGPTLRLDLALRAGQIDVYQAESDTYVP